MTSPLKVAVIDDKPMIRKTLLQAIDWGSLDCTVSGQAEDGFAGRVMLERERPDLLITDIKMPGLSGLELAQWMTENLPCSKTILITGYRDFEYARMAVKQGVYEFIVKPIDYGSLYKVIEAAAADLASARREAQQREQMAEQIGRLEAEFRMLSVSASSKLAADSIGGRAVEEREWAEVLRAFPGCGPTFALLLVRCASPRGGEEPTADAALKRVYEYAREMKRKIGLYTMECFHEGCLAIIAMPGPGIGRQELEVGVRRFGRELAARAEREEGLMIHAAASSLYKFRQGLRQAYEESRGLLETSFFRAGRQVLTRGMPETQPGQARPVIMRELDSFAAILETEPQEHALQAAERLLAQLETYCGGRVAVMKALLAEVCVSAFRWHYRTTGNELAADKGVDRIVCEVNALGNLAEARAYLRETIRCVKSIRGDSEIPYRQITRQILDYIQQSYDQDVSLTGVAERFKLSPNYLSRILRRETGENFVNIVAKMRIQAAKRLLEDPTRKVGEVGEMVGFKEYAYFYQVFKRLTGTAPKEYQQAFRRS